MMYKRRICLWMMVLSLWLGNVAQAEPVRLQVQSAPASAVLMSVARLGGFNLLLADDIGGTVTVNVQEEPAQILELIAASKGLLLERYGTVYVVTTPDKAGTLRRVHVYQAKYARLADLAKVANLSLGEAGKKSHVTKNNNSVEKADKAQQSQAQEPEKNPSRVLVDESAGAVLFYGTDAEAQ